MKTQNMGTGALAPRPQLNLEKWADALDLACNAISGSSPDLMKSVSVTGILDGTEGEAQLLMVLSKQLAGKRRLHVTFGLAGRNFTARFSRKVDTATLRIR